MTESAPTGDVQSDDLPPWTIVEAYADEDALRKAVRGRPHEREILAAIEYVREHAHSEDSEEHGVS